MAKNKHYTPRAFRLRTSAWLVASSLALAAFPQYASAAGLGKVTVLSALGQPLRAEVEVFATREELAGMKAQLAAADAFKQAGVDYAPALHGINFSLIRRANGQPVIRLSSERPINEPFMDLLLELNWSSGRLIREYTFLLDPPDYAARNAATAVTKPVALPPPFADAPARAERPVRMASPRPRPSEPPIPAGAGATAREVRRGETLGQIASELRPDGVSLDQMLAGLYRANPDAFDRGNMNRLKAGKVLSVPDKDALQAIPREDARRTVIAQSADWSGYRRRLATAASEAPIAAEDARAQASGKVTTRVEDRATAGQEPRDQLRVSRTEAAASRSPAAGKRPDEDLIAKEKALREANERLASLERSVAELQRLLELKSKTLAELEKQSTGKSAPAAEPGKPAGAAVPASATTAPPVATPTAPATPTGRVEPTPAPAPSEVTAKPPDKPAERPAEVKPETPPRTETGGTQPTSEAKPEVARPVEPAKPAEALKPVEAPKPAEPPKPKATVPPAEEPGFLEELATSTPFLAGGGGIIALLAAYWFVKRRRDAENSRPFEASSTLTPAGDSLMVNSVFHSTGGQSVDTSHSMAQTDFSQAGPGSIDTDEVDPVAEADVYMAYGRDAQAEEILLEAKQKDPGRHAIHLKLLEIYLARKDSKPFDLLISELYKATGGVGPDWEKAAAMGLQVDPENPLFAGALRNAEGPARDSETTLIVRPDALQSTIAKPGQLAQMAQAAVGAEAPTQVIPPRQTEVETRLQTADLADLDFDFGTSDASGASSPKSTGGDALAVEKTIAYRNSDQRDALDFDLSASMPTPAPLASDDFDDDSRAVPVSDEIYPPEITMLVAPRPPAGGASDDTDLGFHFDLASEPPEPVAPSARSAGVMPPAAKLPPQAQPLAPARAVEDVVDIGSADEGALDFDVKLTDSTVLGHAMQVPSAADMASISLDLTEVDVFAPSSRSDSSAAQATAFDMEQEDTLVNPGFSGTQEDTLVNSDFSSAMDMVSDIEISSNEEVSTKIELARAYEEMGDVEGARELLQEVLRDGDAAQRTAAQALLAGLRE
ncbi:MAG: FimV/HubP family polar landmark protein [Candidatus Accumulibacter sp.]|uniref:FimV/HubP family polar landmark protein n=1 Tax=Accumulibacter sp. TaxID=2053492 RepID=UPI00287AA923|nr:FimV/HubP family polar landmark protein [Accumulibacter sp.]MDS4016011.1 FimV/HubP family polar landmark protein [Accumulibacter sp.]